MSPAGVRHGFIAARLAVSIGSQAAQSGLGRVCAAETGFLLNRDPDTVRAPDLAFVRAQHVARLVGVEGYAPGAPDLAIEVRSPGDSRRQVDEKVGEWLAGGATAVMVVDPTSSVVSIHRHDQTVAVFGPRDVVSLPELLPGWTLPVEDLLRP